MTRTFTKKEEFDALDYNENYYLQYGLTTPYSAEQDKLNGVNIGHLTPVVCYYDSNTSVEINTSPQTTITKTDGTQWGLLVGSRPKRKGGGI